MQQQYERQTRYNKANTTTVLLRLNKQGLVTFKYQQRLKNGRWGAVREGNNQYHSGKTPQEILDYWESVNQGKKFRLVEE